MAEKKRGFHALEKRIHELEEEDRTQEQRSAEPEKDRARRESPLDQGEKKRSE